MGVALDHREQEHATDGQMLQAEVGEGDHQGRRDCGGHHLRLKRVLPNLISYLPSIYIHCIGLLINLIFDSIFNMALDMTSVPIS